MDFELKCKIFFFYQITPDLCRMFNREAYKEVHKQLSPDSTEDEIEKYLDDMESKYNTIKGGDNVIHITYYTGVVDGNDITELESILAKSNLELSRFDKTGSFQASQEEFMLQTYVWLNSEVTKNLIVGLAGSAIWDTVKTTVVYIWRKCREIQINHITSTSIEKRHLSFGIKVQLEENNYFDFKLEGDVSEETCLKSLDKAIDFLKTFQSNKNGTTDNFLRFNKETSEWEIVDIIAEINKIVEKSRNKA